MLQSVMLRPVLGFSSARGLVIRRTAGIATQHASSTLSTATTTTTTTTIGESNGSNAAGEVGEGDVAVLRPLIVCGPSGVGKGTIIEHYMKHFPFSRHFGFTTSHTTRSPRPGEVNGVHYHFLPFQKMKEAISAGEFLEHAEVHGNLYGTSFDAMRHVQETSGKICLLDIDVQGVKNVKDHETQQAAPPVKGKFIFIAPPSMQVLEVRLKGRGTETAESLSRRTKNAQMEMNYGTEQGNFDFTVVNEDIEQACRDFDAAAKAMYTDLLD